MSRLPPGSTLTYTHFTYTTLFRSAVQVDAGATDGHQLKLMLRRRHACRPLPDRRRPSPAMNVKYILFLHSKQYTFHFRARLAAGLGAARDGGFWLAAKA